VFIRRDNTLYLELKLRTSLRRMKWKDGDDGPLALAQRKDHFEVVWSTIERLRREGPSQSPSNACTPAAHRACRHAGQPAVFDQSCLWGIRCGRK